jgi:hypothetical protein
MAKWTGVIAVPVFLLVAGAMRVRRKAAGFSRRDLGRPEFVEGARAIRRVFRWTSIVQFAGSALCAWLGTRLHREDLIWPGIALVVSLHFAPLGLVFRMRPYLGAAIAGALVAAAALLLPASLLTPASRFALVGAGMGVVVWITAAYAILRADDLARAWAAAEPR